MHRAGVEDGLTPTTLDIVEPLKKYGLIEGG